MPYSKNRNRKCQYCSKEYILGEGESKHKYCSVKCRREWHYDRWKSNGGKRDPQKLREYQLKTNYGISLEIFDKAFDEQGQCCYICKSKDYTGSNWHVDHCHETRLNRSILCKDCNQALGLVKENSSTLKKMIDYIEYFGNNVNETLNPSKPVTEEQTPKYELIDTETGQVWTASTILKLRIASPIGADAIRKIIKNENQTGRYKKYKIKIYEQRK